VIPVPSAASVLVIFSVIVFITGSAFGALVLFTVSLHRTRRSSLFKASGDERGATSRSLLLSARNDRKEESKP
jgi:hypothetical protein